LRTAPASRHGSGLSTCLPGPPDPGGRAGTFPSPPLQEAPPGTSCHILAPTLPPNRDKKIETKMCLTQFIAPATQKPSESDFLSPPLFHKMPPFLPFDCFRFFHRNNSASLFDGRLHQTQPQPWAAGQIIGMVKRKKEGVVSDRKGCIEDLIG